MSINLDDNLEQTLDGTVRCRHCATTVGTAADPLGQARVRESDPSDAGPGVRSAAHHHTKRPIVLRQSFCPECLTLLQSEIVPGDEPSYRSRSVIGEALS